MQLDFYHGLLAELPAILPVSTLLAPGDGRGLGASSTHVHDLVDTPGSMAWKFPEINKSKAEVARDAHLEFLDMRRNKNDRVLLWLFSTESTRQCGWS